jgi:PTS system cellobiose-specific IIC component
MLVKLQEAGGKLQNHPIFQAMNGGMMGTMSLILTGAVFTITATLLNLAGIIPQDGTLYQWLMVPYNMTMNLLSVPIAFSIAFIYTQYLGKKGELANGIVALASSSWCARPSTR